MANRTLSIWHVATLLISTSCGVGFLLGTGELVLKHGMAACLYSVASAIGLLALAFVAPRLWKTGQSIWAHFDALYGQAVSRQVALLSLIWMTGVLSAQIRGASSILGMSGVAPAISIAVIDGLVLGLSFIRLSWLSGMFALCMGGCNAILVYALIKTHGLTIWFSAPAHFAESIHFKAIGHAGLTLLSVVAMVVCGADYQQFPIAARTPTAAWIGCVIAAAIVFAIGFLPASAVLASTGSWHLYTLSDPVQAVPRTLIATLGHSSGLIQAFVISGLLVMALGSACSIMRAMVDATTALSPGVRYALLLPRAIPVCASTLMATRGEGMIDMMITLNIVYLAAVGPLLALTVLGHRIDDQNARRSILTGFGIVMACYLILWTHVAHMSEVIPLILAWPCALIEALRARTPVNAQNNQANGLTPLILTKNHPIDSSSSLEDSNRSAG
jgi:solute:Na+ symporter, SSS family